MKRCKRIIPLLLILLLLPVPVSAAGSINPNAQTSLTISARYGEIPITGMEFRVYQVATMDSTGELTVTTPFSAYADMLDIRGKNDSAWWDMATRLEREIVLNPVISAEAAASVSSTGIARFDSLPKGLYLAMSESMQIGTYVYTTSPFFVMLPTQNKDSNSWDYDISANAKPAQNPVVADFEVVKIWKDDCHKDKRPKSITIDLMCDGKKYDTITLPHDGHWSYIWKDLDVNRKWTVTEAQEKGYKKPDIKQEGNTFVVTNTCATPGKPAKPNLPQSGQLWWPVPVLLTTGLLFVIIGLLRRRRFDDET